LRASRRFRGAGAEPVRPGFREHFAQAVGKPLGSKPEAMSFLQSGQMWIPISVNKAHRLSLHAGS